MCGIAGILAPEKNTAQLQEIAGNMAARLRHRGPDAQHSWSCEQTGFGHARLAIFDLSPHGLQPMTSANSHFTICFNGEIYNFPELKKHLAKVNHDLRGSSDTEVFLECIAHYGLDWTLANARGMFAFGLWDDNNKKLTLARDRLGEKPLYYGYIGRDLVFASELKAFRAHPNFSFNIDKKALSAYVKYSYIPTPLCILEGFRKLPPATTLTGTSHDNFLQMTPARYWDHTALQTISGASTHGLENLLLQTIESEMASDVALGCFLSGGIDSSLVASLMQHISATPIETFTIGFNEKRYDESTHAKAVAEHLGAKHTEWIISQQDVLNIIPTLANIYDEPFADSSQLPTTLLSQMTRKAVTVCLSGDGGDELFCGYERYLQANKINQWLAKTPRFAKNLYRNLYQRKSPQQWANIAARSPIKINNLANRMAILDNYASHQSTESLYDSFLTHWPNPKALVVDGQSVSIVNGTFQQSRSFIENMMLQDTAHYLSDDIMVKVDRATMSASLESRAPLLDHKIYEYAWSMPLDAKLVKGTTKQPLREILYKRVPRAIIDRPKMGFGVPLEHWFRHELKQWCDDTLNETTLKNQGLFNPEQITQYWSEHRSGVSNRQFLLWDILSFQQWYNHWSD